MHFNGAATLEKCMAVSYKTECVLTIWHSNLHCWAFILEKWWLMPMQNLDTIAPISFMALNWKQSFNGWMVKYKPTMEYNSAIQKNRLLVHLWKDLKGIMLTEKIQSQKILYCIVPFIKYFWNGKIVEMENTFVVVKG